MGTYDNQVTFSYQRLGDVLRAMLLAETSSGSICRPGTHRSATTGGRNAAPSGHLQSSRPRPSAPRSSTCSRTRPDDRVEYDIDRRIRRKPGRYGHPNTPPTEPARIVEQLVDFEEWTDQVWEQLVRVACVPGHRVNAEWTHELFYVQASAGTGRNLVRVAHRVYRLRRRQRGPRAARLGWHPRKTTRDTSPLPTDVAHLATLILGMDAHDAGPSRPRPRDESAGQRRRTWTGGIRHRVPTVPGCDDPYVIERLAAATLRGRPSLT